jgi:hypothetical protein
MQVGYFRHPLQGVTYVIIFACLAWQYNNVQQVSTDVLQAAEA